MRYLFIFLFIPAIASAECSVTVDPFTDGDLTISDMGLPDDIGDCVFVEADVLGGVRHVEVIITEGLGGEVLANYGWWPDTLAWNSSSGIRSTMIVTYGFYEPLGQNFECTGINPRFELDMRSEVLGYVELTLWSGCAHETVMRQFIGGLQVISWPDSIWTHIDIETIDRIELSFDTRLGVDAGLYDFSHTASGGDGYQGATQARGGMYVDGDSH